MAETPTLNSGAYPDDLETIRSRVEYDGAMLFDDNAQLRFDQLLVTLEERSRGIFETLWGDQTPLEETGRVDEIRAHDERATMLVYPINDVTKVERKTSNGGDWIELDSDWYDHTKHRLVLARRHQATTLRHDNPLSRRSRSATWADIAVKLRVTYDRGFSDVPADILSVQIEIINRMLRHLRMEQNASGLSINDLAGISPEFDEVVTDEIRQRISDVTSPGGATMSV